MNIFCMSFCVHHHDGYVHFVILLFCYFIIEPGTITHVWTWEERSCQIKDKANYFNVIITQYTIFSKLYLTLSCMSLTQYGSLMNNFGHLQ